MSYSSKYGITKIIPDCLDNLSINWDHILRDEHGVAYLHPILFHTPDMDNTNTHYHISLSVAQARTLLEWLQDYIEDIS
jgi:hypothetical protein